MRLLYLITNYCYPGQWPRVLSTGYQPALGIDPDPKVGTTVGIHPRVAHLADDGDLIRLERQLPFRRVVGLGEVGMEYQMATDDHTRTQKMLLLAVQYQLPVVIQARRTEAGTDCLRIPQEVLPPSHQVHHHCFTGGARELTAWAEAFPKCYLSISGTIRNNPSAAAKDVGAQIPGPRLLLETDSPHLKPARTSEGSPGDHYSQRQTLVPPLGHY